MIVSTNDYETNIANNIPAAFLGNCLAAAQRAVETKLGYLLESGSRTKTFLFNGCRTFNLGEYNVTVITSVTVGDTLLDASKYSVEDYFLTLAEDVGILRGESVEIEFEAGWTAENLPKDIFLAILYIAQALTKNKGTGGYATQANFGEGNIVFDQAKYFRFFDMVKEYRIASLW